MAFSESFEFGDNTLKQLIKTEKSALKIKDCDNVNDGSDVILESPPKVNTSINRTRFRHNGNKSARHHFRRSKSDTKLPSPYQRAKINAPPHNSERYDCSDFFRSDILFNVGEPKLASFIRVSENEADLETKNNFTESEHLEVSSSVLDEAIFSEDVRKLLADIDEEEYDNVKERSFYESVPNVISCLPRHEQQNDRHPQCVDEFVQLDESSFICSAVLDNRAAIFTATELQSSHSSTKRELLEYPSLNETQAEINGRELSVKLTSPFQIHKIQTQEEPAKQRRASLSTIDKESLKALSSWGLPRSILLEYEKKGVQKMFDWQVECLRNAKVLFEHSNLVYSAPTSAGKTLVSEILLIKTVTERNKKVFMILPFISVVREKMFYLQDLLSSSGYRVDGYFGGYIPPGGLESIHVAMFTIEKANSMINKLLEQGKLEEIGMIVVDEVHLISDPGRGYILELLLAKILYMSQKYGYKIQVVAMSATLANIHLLQQWLHAELFITDFRPVALREMIKIGTKIFDNQMNFLRDIAQDETKIEEKEAFPKLANDSDHCAQLCIETILLGCSAIVFCPSKDWCETLAVQLASVTHALIKSGSDWGKRLRAQFNKEAIEKVKKQLLDISTGLDSVLEKTITCGCAFHHAGLTTEERDIVEASFKSGALKIIVATSTLSSGVNLPARRVLIRSPLFAGKPMSSLTYKQMIGRAGRTGKDTLGESILICTEATARAGRELIGAELRPIKSCLDLDNSTHLKRALLEVISSNVASSKVDLITFVNCTLLNAQNRSKANENISEKASTSGDISSTSDENSIITLALKFLMEYEFIRLQNNSETGEEQYVATRLGMACLASSMSPTDGLILFSELQKSRRCFVLESELHAVYLVTPYSVCHQMQNVDWLFFLDLWERLPPAMKKVGELVGVKESFLVRAMRGQTNLDYKLLQIHKRFYTALALQELVNEIPINVVANKYKCTRGLLQTLQQMASTFAGIVTSFCNSLKWYTLSLLMSQFKERLFFGVHRDLIDLLRLPDLSHKRARILFDAGITTLVELANADVLNLERILHNSLSFDSEKQHEHENSYEAEQRKSARIIFMTGGRALTVLDASKLLIQQARHYMQLELGVENINWAHYQKEHSYKKGANLHMSYENSEQMALSKKSSVDSDIGQTNANRLELPTKQIIVLEEPMIKVIGEKEEANAGNKENVSERIAVNRQEMKNKKLPSKKYIDRSRSLSLTKKTTFLEVKSVPLRKSPRNHVSKTNSSQNPVQPKSVKPNSELSLLRLQKAKPNIEELFGDDSFVMNSGITKALLVPTIPKPFNFDDNENKCKDDPNQYDEIPNSQDFIDLNGNSVADISRHQSRLLRSNRTPGQQNTQRSLKVVEIKLEKNSSKLSKVSKEGIPVDENGNGSSNSIIELSDLSMENSLLKNPMHLNASHVISCSTMDTDASCFKYIDVIDISGHDQLFQRATKELLEAKRIGFCLGLQQLERKHVPLIGSNLLGSSKSDSTTSPQSVLFHVNDSTYLSGVAFCLGSNISLHLNMQEEGCYTDLTTSMKCNLLLSLFHNSQCTLLCFDVKEQLKILHSILPELGEIRASLEDPKVANWLLQPDKAMTFQQMTQQFAPECTGLVQLCGGSGRGLSSFGLDASNNVLSKLRCTIEACVTMHILTGQNENLERIGTSQLKKFFNELEMPLQSSLANMEVYGFPASESAFQQLFLQMVDSKKKLEERIFELHGQRFNLGSPQAVARVVGLHRKPKGRMSTSKQILERIDSPIAQLIITYRKLIVALTKNIQPLLKSVRGDRIHGNSITLTATGRIAMMEPNLQNVAKDFDVELGHDRIITISCRSAFLPTTAKRFLISSDFCQLEMRILAHLSQDTALQQVMNSSTDIFTAIAARWNHINELDVSEQLRNGTKQICYAIVYGMGMRSLAESLKSTEQEAVLVSEQFHATYPGIRSYIQKVVKYARNNGYIETITGRRRYLEHINSDVPMQKKQAERQAVNSTIQGSAADIAKSAIIRIEKNISKYRHKLGLTKDDSVHLVLHLHDELIFEVPEEKAKKIAKLLCVTMENCVRLNVPLKVKVKMGRSWGQLKEIKL